MKEFTEGTLCSPRPPYRCRGFLEGGFQYRILDENNGVYYSTFTVHVHQAPDAIRPVLCCKIYEIFWVLAGLEQVPQGPAAETSDCTSNLLIFVVLVDTHSRSHSSSQRPLLYRNATLPPGLLRVGAPIQLAFSIAPVSSYTRMFFCPFGNNNYIISVHSNNSIILDFS